MGEVGDGPAAVQALNTLRPELVFLDIQMPGMLGTDVLTTVAHQPLVVFTTAFAQHAVAGFELGALDYLLKPFGKERLVKSLERIRAAEARLDATRFLRIHRTHIVNLDHVVAFRRRDGGRVEAELHDGSRLPVSRERAKELRVVSM